MINSGHRLASAVASASLLAFAACSGRSGERSDSAKAAASGGEVARRPDSAAGAVAPGAAAAPKPQSSAATSSAASTTSLRFTGGDPEILQVIAVVDQTEIRDGELAEKKARNAEVKLYARELVTDHSKSLQEDRAIAKSAKVDLSGVMISGKSDTAGPTGAAGVTADLINMHTQAIEQVRKLEGTAFDSAFVNAQVKGHQEVLALLQSAQGQNPEVQQHLAAAIKGVQSHLEKAQKVQQSLASGASGAPSDTTLRPKTKPDTTGRG